MLTVSTACGTVVNDLGCGRCQHCLRVELLMTDLTSRRQPFVDAGVTDSAGMFGRIGSLVVRRSRAVLLVSLLVFLVGAGLGFTAFGKLKAAGFTDPNSGSARATRQLDSRFGGAANLVLRVHASSGTVDDPAVAGVGNHSAALLAAVPGVARRVVLANAQPRASLHRRPLRARRRQPAQR